jgi:hypothetical protein
VGYGLVAELAGDEVRLRWDETIHGGLAAVRVVSDGRFGERELARVSSVGFAERVEPGETRRYRLVGVRADGSEAPPSPVLVVEVPE